LLNAWSRSDKAIVTDIAGTTRDVVEASVVVAGVPVTLLDTAGIRSDTRGDAVEAIGVERSLAAAKGADAVLLVVDARSGWADEDREVWERLVDVNASKNESEETATFEDEDAFGKNEFENARARLYATRGGLERFAGTERDASREWNDSNDAFHLESSFSETVNESDSERRVPLLLALNKTDAVPEKERKNVKADVPRDVLDASDAVVETSAVTRAGLDALETALATIVGAGEIEAEGAQWAANQRQAEALRVAAAALARLAETVQDGLPVDFWTIDLREAAAALGEITGEDIAEDVLDVVFTKFCIGK
jgi:tRNA modification GTPase